MSKEIKTIKDLQEQLDTYESNLLLSIVDDENGYSDIEWIKEKGRKQHVLYQWIKSLHDTVLIEKNLYTRNLIINTDVILHLLFVLSFSILTFMILFFHGQPDLHDGLVIVTVKPRVIVLYTVQLSLIQIPDISLFVRIQPL